MQGLGYSGAETSEYGASAGRGRDFIILRFMPILPGLLGKVLYIVAVEHLPEGRTEYPLRVQDGETEGVGINQLMGVIVNTDLAADTFRGDQKGDNGFADHVEVLGQTAQGHVHIVKGLGEHIDGNAVMAVILEEMDGGFGEGLIVPIVELHASFIYDHLAILYHVHTAS